MSIDELALILVRGLGQGAIYALIGMSFNVVVNSSGILNFANGALLILAGVLAYVLLPGSPDWLVWTLAAAGIAACLLFFVSLQGIVTLFPLKSSVEQHSWLVTTMAVSVILSAFIHLYGGSLAFRVPAILQPVSVFGLSTPAAYFLVIALAVFWFFVIRWFYQKTFTGLAMSAIAQDLDAAKAAGISVKKIQLSAFGISGLVLATTGFVGAPVINISADAGIGYLLSGFTALVIGGLGSNVGALAGGALVGVLSMFAAYRFGGIYQDTVTMGLLIAVLMFRPEGIFGLAAARKV